MATASTDRVLFEDIFLCSICLQPFDNPKLLPCLHSFCRNCLGRHFQIECSASATPQPNPSSPLSSPKRLTCPACRASVIVPGGQVNSFYDDHSIGFTKSYLTKCFGHFDEGLLFDYDDQSQISSSGNDNDLNTGNDENIQDLKVAGEYREWLRLNVKPIEKNLVELRSKIIYVGILTDHVHRLKLQQTMEIGEAEPVNHELLLKQVDISFRPVLARIADVTEKLFRASCDQKAVYGLVEELVEKGTYDKLITTYEPLASLVQDFKTKPSILNEDLHDIVADLNIDMSQVDSEVHKTSEGLELSLHPLKNIVFDVSKRLICRLSRCGDKPGQFNYPVHATFLPDGGFLVCDKKNRRIQIFDRSGRFKEEFMKGRIKPRRARLNITNGLLYVSDEHTETVKVYTMGGKLIRSIGENFFMCPAGLDFDTEGNVVVTDAEKATVSVYSPDGKALNKFCYAYFQPRVPCPYFAACSSEGHIIVSDYRNNTVRGFTTNGREMFCISDLKHPRGVCVDKSGNILIAEGDAHRVSLYSPYGKFLQFVLSKQDGLIYPMSVDIDNDLRVIVTQCGLFNNHEVMIFQLTYGTADESKPRSEGNLSVQKRKTKSFAEMCQELKSNGR